MPLRRASRRAHNVITFRAQVCQALAAHDEMPLFATRFGQNLMDLMQVNGSMQLSCVGCVGCVGLTEAAQSPESPRLETTETTETTERKDAL